MILFGFGLALGLLFAGFLGVCLAVGAFSQGYNRAVGIHKEIRNANEKGHTEGYDKAVEDLAKLEAHEQVEPEAKPEEPGPMLWATGHLEYLYQWLNQRHYNGIFMDALRGGNAGN